MKKMAENFNELVKEGEENWRGRGRSVAAVN